MSSVIVSTGFEWRRQRWLLAGLVFVFAVIYVQFAFKVQSSTNTRSAFLRWRAQLDELDDGVNVWEKYAYPNPPIMAILLKPFHALPPTLGSSLWFLLKAAFAFASILMVWRLLEGTQRIGVFPTWAKALTLLMTLRPIEGDLVHGNVNLLILFLLVATLSAFCNRRDSLAGFLLGLSVACKLTPALFLLYLAYKRAWRSLLAASAGLFVFGLVIPSLYFGWQNNLDYLRSWHQQMIAPYAAGVVTSEHKNQSLPGLLHRMLTEEASFSDYVGDTKVVLETHNLVSWDHDTVRAITIGAMILFTLLAMRYCPASTADQPRLPMMAEFSVVILGMLLFCERTWKHHCVTLLLPFAVIAYALSMPTVSRPLRWYLGGTLGLVTILMLSTSTGIFAGQDRLGKLSQVYGAYVWAFLLLLACQFVILRKTSSAIAAENLPHAAATK